MENSLYKENPKFPDLGTVNHSGVKFVKSILFLLLYNIYNELIVEDMYSMHNVKSIKLRINRGMETRERRGRGERDEGRGRETGEMRLTARGGEKCRGEIDLIYLLVAKSGPPCLKGVEVWGQPNAHNHPDTLSSFFSLAKVNNQVLSSSPFLPSSPPLFLLSPSLLLPLPSTSSLLPRPFSSFSPHLNSRFTDERECAK